MTFFLTFQLYFWHFNFLFIALILFGHFGLGALEIVVLSSLLRTKKGLLSVALKPTIYQIVKNFKERGLVVVKKASGWQRKYYRGISGAGLAQERQRVWVHLHMWGGNKPLHSRKNTRDRLVFWKRYRDWAAEDGGKVIFFDKSPPRLFGASEKKRRSLSGQEQVILIIIRVDDATPKYPETIRVWVCSSTSLTTLPANKERCQNVLWEQTPPIIQEQSGDELCLFQQDGAPCQRAKMIT